MDDILRQAEALLRFSGEVENRMAESGLGGVDGVIERYVQLRQALDRLSQRELDWAKTEVDRLIETLTEGRHTTRTITRDQTRDRRPKLTRRHRYRR